MCLFALVCLAGLIGISCNKNKDDQQTPSYGEKTPYKVGAILTYSFAVDDDTVVKMKDEVVDYGVENFPVLMLVHKETLIQETGWGSIFHPLKREDLDSVLVIWASAFKMDNFTPQDRAFIASAFLDYIVTNNLDAGLFVDLILGGHGTKLVPVMEVISEVIKSGKPPNDCVYRMMYEYVSPDGILAELKPTKQVRWIYSIYHNEIMTGWTWVKFANNNGPVSTAPKNYMSFLCSWDTVMSDYPGGTAFRSRDYKLSYDAGYWEAKCTYHVEGIYNVWAKMCQGKYIPKCNTISTYVHVKGIDFIVDGEVGYSQGVNVGTVNEVIAAMKGKAQVTYGDCCLFRKYSVLEFQVNASTGYTEKYFDDGK